MPLTIIKGPPNSGRTEQVRRRYLDLLPQGPVLVVPGVDDIFGWERRLTDDTGALAGGQIVHFKDLYGEILELDKGKRLKAATELQRIRLMREAIIAGWHEVAGRLTDQPGLVDSVLQLVDDFRAELVDVETLATRIAEAELHYLRSLTTVYRLYMEFLVDRDRLTDGPREARRALDLVSELWGARPVMFVGFDELTRLQLEMINRLAFVVGAEVTVAVTHEQGNPALALTDRLVTDLKELGPEKQITVRTTSRGDEDPPHDKLLIEVEKRFMRAAGSEHPPLEADEALTVLRSTGQRNEAEAIAAEVAKLLAEGAEAGQIAIAVEAPGQNGRMIRDTFERFSIPTTLESETQVRSTVIGESILNLIKAAGPADSAAAFLALLRSPIGPPAGQVDRLERKVRINGVTSARGAADLLESSPPALWTDITSALEKDESVAELISGGASDLAFAILARENKAPSAATVTETRTAGAIARAAREVGGFPGAGNGLEMIGNALQSGAVKVWSVPANGTVRIASPYSLRAKRVEYLFCASLQESGLTDTDRAGPFLSVKDRKALLMSEHRDPEVQQRYLFYSSITVPTKRLWLSCRNSDETGKAEHPSPLIGAVEELFSRDPDGTPIVRRGGRRGSEITFQPDNAPSEAELARSLASNGVSPQNSVTESGIEGELARSVLERLENATETEKRTRRLASITLEPILRTLGENVVLAATEIEAYAGCPYRWFIDRQLNPERFEPDPDYLSMGTLLHDTLEELYGKHPGEIPRESTIDDWLAEVPGLVRDNSRQSGVGLGSNSVSHAALRSRAVQLISAHLVRESKWHDPRHLPAELEAKIGTSGSDRPPIPMGKWSLKGKIDRIDLSPKTPTGVLREAVVIDYKSGNLGAYSQKKTRKERKFQVQLYLHAVRNFLSDDPKEALNPVAGLYVPLRVGDEKARGAFSKSVNEEMLDRGVSSEDEVGNLEEFIKAGLEMADESAGKLMLGILEHDPATCPNHFDHPAVPDRPGDFDSDSGGAGF